MAITPECVLAAEDVYKITVTILLFVLKLLPDLSYTKEMNILCVTNGKHTLNHKKFNIREFIRRRAQLEWATSTENYM